MAERIIRSGQRTGNQRHLEVGWATLVPALYSLGDFDGVFFYLDRLHEAHGGYVDQVRFDQWIALASSWVSLWMGFRQGGEKSPTKKSGRPTPWALGKVFGIWSCFLAIFGMTINPTP